MEKALVPYGKPAQAAAGLAASAMTCISAAGSDSTLPALLQVFKAHASFAYVIPASSILVLATLYHIHMEKQLHDLREGQRLTREELIDIRRSTAGKRCTALKFQNKADKSHVRRGLKRKADRQQVERRLRQKADSDDVDARFNDKADKADTYTRGQVDRQLNRKAGSDYVDARFKNKADKSDTYTKGQVDHQMNQKAHRSFWTRNFGIGS